MNYVYFFLASEAVFAEKADSNFWSLPYMAGVLELCMFIRSALGVVASVTKRVQLVTMVIRPTLHYRLVVILQLPVTVVVLSDNRLTFTTKVGRIITEHITSSRSTFGSRGARQNYLI